MLEKIYIKNFAIIDAATVSFASGFNVLSGETGAGKSILIDALGLQMGGRADIDWIRSNENRAEIQSHFNLEASSPVVDFLKDNEFDDGLGCQLRRTLNRGTPSKCYINGIPTTLKNTQLLGESLIHIHGQHAHQSLMQPQKQKILLDQFAKHAPLIESTQTAFKDWQALIKRQQTLMESTEIINEKIDLLNYQINEFNQLNLQEGEFEQLTIDHKKLANASRLLEISTDIEDVLEQVPNHLSGQVSAINGLLLELSTIDASSQEMVELFAQLMIYVDEFHDALQSYKSQIDLDPDALVMTEARMSEIYSVARKYNVSADELSALNDSRVAELESLKNDQKTFLEIGKLIDLAYKKYEAAAKKLSQSRVKKAKSLVQSVNARLFELGMSEAKFEIAFEKSDSPQSDGVDKVSFLFSPNPGQAAKLLHKIASGGELSRISLAIQVAGVSEKTEETLIFDEVDSGIGGATAEVVGRLLKTLAQYNQVICVTHLAQVAAFADQHLFISKEVVEQQTFTRFKVLGEDDRVGEIARMSGGIEMDKKTIEHAQNIIDNAKLFSDQLTCKRKP